MGLSRSTFYSALGSCLAHSTALGLASTLIVSSPSSLSRVVKVTLWQPAVPLPVGESGSPSAGTLAPEPEKRQSLVLQPQARPAPQLTPKPKPIAKRPPRPTVAASPPVKPQQVASSVLPPITDSIASEISTGVGREEVTGNDKEGTSGGGSKAGVGTGSGVGEGKGGGNSARPDYSVNPKPPYPLIARRLGAQGIVILRVQVREDGSVAAVELARSSGFTMLDDSATRTVRESWRFLPARIDGSPVASWVEVPIRFVLEDS